jgi:hypothetical protein
MRASRPIHVRISLQALCQVDDTVVRLLRQNDCGSLARVSLAAVMVGSALFGFAFGIWRAPEQALYAAIKMPAMILALVGVSSLINIMLAYVLGSRLSAIQTTTCVLLSLAITSVILAALSPVTLFFALQCPAPTEPGSMTAYRCLLTGNTCVVAFAGIAGNVRLYRLLCDVTAARAMALRVLLSWIFVTGLAGTELSWLFSPFLSRPDLPIHFFNDIAFQSNFFEYLWHAVMGSLT